MTFDDDDDVMDDEDEGTWARQDRLTENLLRQMYALAGTPFTMNAFRQRWQEFGWEYTPESGDEFGFRVPVIEDLHLMVAPKGDKIACASLPVYYWEQYEPEWHESAEAHQAEEAQYHAAYDQALRRAEQALGQPARTGASPPTGNEVSGYRYAAWSGETALLILQETAFDTQFGIEINLWLEPCSLAEFAPGASLIAWLESRDHSPDP